jgi:predicted anti-sigma-YlaC factor YlaD
MTCVEYKELISVWFDGELEADEFSHLLDHVSQCAGCRPFMEHLPRQVRLVYALRSARVPSEPLEAERALFPTATRFLDSHIRAPIAIAAAIILVVLTIAIERTLSDRGRDHFEEWGSAPSAEQTRGLH